MGYYKMVYSYDTFPLPEKGIRNTILHWSCNFHWCSGVEVRFLVRLAVFTWFENSFEEDVGHMQDMHISMQGDSWNLNP